MAWRGVACPWNQPTDQPTNSPLPPLTHHRPSASPKTTHKQNKNSAIHILKCHGKSSLESHLVSGFALAGARAAQGMPSVVKNAKIALLDFGLQRHKMQLGVQVRDCLGVSGWMDLLMGPTDLFINLHIHIHTNVHTTQVVVKDVKEVDLIRQREMDITKERIQKILEAGANVVLTTKGIDDLAMKVILVLFWTCRFGWVVVVAGRRARMHACMHAPTD